MAAESYFDMDSYPTSDQAAPPGMYSGNGYGDGPPRPNLQPTQPLVSDDNTLLPRPVSPPVKPTAHLLNKPNLQHPQGPMPNSRLRQQRLQKWKRYLRIMKVATQAISTLLSAIMFAAMVFLAIKHQITKNTIRGGRSAWPKNPKLWPTFLLLITACITLVLSIVTLLSYCFSFNKARRSWKVTSLKYVVYIGVWIVVSVLYRYEKSLHGIDNDLWGWTCSDKGKALQAEFHGVVNFSGLCQLQVRKPTLKSSMILIGQQSSSWETSLAEFVIKAAFAVGHFILYRKTRDDEKQNLADRLGGATTDLVEDIF